MTGHPPKPAGRAERSSAKALTGPDEASIEARCDVLAVVRECIDGRRAAWIAKGIEAGIELPCGPLPWLALDEKVLRRTLGGALDRVAKHLPGGQLSVALWWEAAGGEGSLQVEAYAEEPSTGIFLELGLERVPLVPSIVPVEPRGRALLVEEHPAKGRILRAQCARLGMSGEVVAVNSAPEAAATAPHRLVWLSGGDVAHLATCIRRKERQLGYARARIAAARHACDFDSHPDIDALVEWPLSLDRLRALCSAMLWPDDGALRATGQLFLRESRRDAAIIREAIAAADWTTVIRHAHRIKGGTIVLGEDGICELAERLEQAARRAIPAAARMERLVSALERALGDKR